MGRHRRRTGRHRAPSTAGRTAARIVISAGVATAPLVSAEEVFASPPGVAAAIVQCESGGDFTAQNTTSSASGGFQFIRGTWRRFGGTEFAPTARQATRAEQTVVFERAYAANGLADWAASRSCWQPKIGRRAIAENVVWRTAAPRAVYVVRPGDTLSRIAVAHHTTWRKLYERNRDVVTDPDLIHAGQHLRV